MKEQTKRGRGRPQGSLSHVEVTASDLAKYCADHPNEKIVVGRVFWEKKMAEMNSAKLKPVPSDFGNMVERGFKFGKDTSIVMGGFETATISEHNTSAESGRVRVNEINSPEIEMTLTP